MLGSVGILVATAAMLYLAWVSVRSGRFCPMLLAGFYGAAIFCLSYRMHERYLIPALALLLAAVARWADRRLLAGTAVLSMSTLLNLALVLAAQRHRGSVPHQRYRPRDDRHRKPCQFWQAP